jgi:hypothetical protein
MLWLPMPSRSGCPSSRVSVTGFGALQSIGPFDRKWERRVHASFAAPECQ